MYICFKTSFYAVRHLDSTASYLPTGLHLGFFRSWPSLYLPSSFSSVFLVLSFVRSQNCENGLLASTWLSVCLSVLASAWNNSAPTGRIFMTSDIWVFFETLSRRFTFHGHLTIITSTLHEDLRTFLFTPRSVLLRLEKGADKSCREIPNTHFMFNKLLPENRAVFFLNNVWKYDRAGQAKIRLLRLSCWIPQATQTHSAYVLVIAVLYQEWVREHASALRYTYIASLATTEMACVYCAVRTGSLNRMCI